MTGELRHYDEDYTFFLQRLREARKAAGLRQEDVARHMGRRQSWVSKIEAGELRVDFVEASYLARLYRTPLTNFEPPARAPRGEHLAGEQSVPALLESNPEYAAREEGEGEQG